MHRQRVNRHPSLNQRQHYSVDVNPVLPYSSVSPHHTPLTASWLFLRASDCLVYYVIQCTQCLCPTTRIRWVATVTAMTRKGKAVQADTHAFRCAVMQNFPSSQTAPVSQPAVMLGG